MKYLIVLFLLIAHPIAAQEPLPWQTHREQTVNQQVVEKIERHLNEIKTLQASFTQIAPNGNIASGKLYIKRPGKMRWQYDPPVPVIMISRGTILRYYDYELEQVSDMPIKGTLAEFLAKKYVDFNDPDINILYAYEEQGYYTIRITQADSPEDGELAFEFDATQNKLRNIILEDANSQETNISLADARFNSELDEELFKFIGSYHKKRRR